MSTKKKRFKRRMPASEDMVLQITSMADIFTIILVFLLKSAAVGVSNVSPSSDMLLPEVSKGDELSESLKVELSKTSLIFDDQHILDLNEFKFNTAELERDGTPRSLNQAFLREKEKHKLDKTQDTGKLMLLADQQAPYSTVKAILNSAANNGFMDLKLVVVENQ